MKHKQISPLYVRHITVNSGDVAITPRTDVPDSIIDMLMPLIKAEHGIIPSDPEIFFELWNTNESGLPGIATFEFSKTASFRVEGKKPWIHAIACWENSSSNKGWELAQKVAKLSESLGFGNKLPSKPPETPWLCVVIFPDFSKTFLEHLTMFGDMERCIFWTLVESSLASKPYYKKSKQK